MAAVPVTAPTPPEPVTLDGQPVTEPPPGTYFGGPDVAAACLRGWVTRLSRDTPDLSAEDVAALAADLRGALVVLMLVDRPAPDEAMTPMRAAAIAIRAELEDLMVGAPTLQLAALAGRLARVSTDAAERVRGGE